MNPKSFLKKHPLAGGFFIASILAVSALVFYAESKLSHLVLGGLGEAFSTKVYATPVRVFPGSRHSMEELVRRLDRLGYKQNFIKEFSPGQYQRDDSRLSIYLRGSQNPLFSQPSLVVHLTFKPDGVRAIEDGSGNALSQFILEPEQIAELSGSVKIRRDPAKWEEIPHDLVNAVVAVEDKRFFHHWGIDPLAIGRATLHNLAHRKSIQGGSTITQQLAKNLLLTPQRTLLRKILDAFFALYLDRRLGKEEVMTLYLNHIYMGQDGKVSIAGVRAAASYYFGKDLNRLSLQECATLAGIIRSPYRYNPLRDPQAAKSRRNFVLMRMKTEGLIDEAAFEQASRSPLILNHARSLPDEGSDMDYFVNEVIRQLLPEYDEEVLFRSGFSVYTTLDPLLQSAAQAGVAKLKHQGAFVALDPYSGNVLAIVGGKDYHESQFNRATQAKRQPGSAFKPFVYGAALENGYTPASFLQDQKRKYPDGKGGLWEPQNYDGKYRGTVTVRQALADSINMATLDLAERVGIEEAINFAGRMGLESPLEDNLATALGASGVGLLELTAAYAPFANGGSRIYPYTVTTVVDSEGHVLKSATPERAPAMDANLAYLMTSLLETVVQEGTGKGLSALGWSKPTAGKTGTSSEGRDAWFIGFTPEILAGLWTGEDQDSPIQASGAKDAIPAWAEIMKKADNGLEPLPFVQPKELVTVSIDPASGLRARSGCPQRIKEIFMPGTEPVSDCPLHEGGIKGYFRRIFKGKER